MGYYWVIGFNLLGFGSETPTQNGFCRSLWILIVFFKVFLLLVYYFRYISVYNTVLSFKYLYLGLINLFTKFLSELGLYLTYNSTIRVVLLGSFSFSSSFYNLVREERSSFLYKFYINILDTDYWLYFKERSLDYNNQSIFFISKNYIGVFKTERIVYLSKILKNNFVYLLFLIPNKSKPKIVKPVVVKPIILSKGSLY